MEEAEADEEQHDTPLARAALILRGPIATRPSCSLDEISAQHNLSRSALERQLHAVAEASIQHQVSTHDSILRFVSTMHRAKALQPVAYVSHILFDETPLPATVRFQTANLETEKATERSKLFVVEHQWQMLLKWLQPTSWPDPSPVNNKHPLSNEQFTLIVGKSSPALRAAQRTTGEGIHAVLVHTVPEPAALDCFSHRLEIAECDEYGANSRALQLTKNDNKFNWTSTVLLCGAHKLHAAAEKTWQMASTSPIVSGLIHAALFLRTPGKLRELHHALRRIVSTWPIRVRHHERCDLQHEQHRKLCLQLFAPPPLEQPRRAALAHTIASDLLNGNWLLTGTLEHFCKGPTCCQSEDDLRAKLRKFIPKLLVACRVEVFQKNNWVDWVRGLRPFGLLHALHGVLGGSFCGELCENRAREGK